MALIECKNISISYEGPVVVRDLSFAVNRSDFLCIIGENGSGKTTLIKALLGLLRPTAGSISFGDGLKQNQIGYLPQQTGIQRDFPASVTEVVLSGTLSRHSLSPFYTKADKTTARENMAKLGIEAIAAKSYRDLSGGQQQRVLLARALCATEQLILLDEPTAGLDPVVTDEMYNIITSLNRDHGITVIMVTHDIGAAMKYASHILHLTADSAFFGRTADYAKSDIGRLFSGRAV